MKVLITGAAGFIGYHTAKRFLADGHEVIGLDTLNSYYDPNLKRSRLDQIQDHPSFSFVQASISDKTSFDRIFGEGKFDVVINLAAQAGVRHSINKPYEYIDANLLGFINVLEACRNHPIKHLIFASSSSVYGDSDEIPFKEISDTNHPVSLYAATKKANEMMAHSYSSLYGIPATGLRFFTVYGPWGRPDMAYYKFTKSILNGDKIQVFNQGQSLRDFTYVDDIVESIKRLAGLPPQHETPFSIYNIGNHNPVRLMDFIRTLEKVIGKEANMELMPEQPGDVTSTYADVSALNQLTGFTPGTELEDGLGEFVQWFKNVYEVK